MIPLPIAFTAWGFVSDANYGGKLAPILKAAHITTIGVEYGQVTPIQVQDLKNLGFYVVVWGVMDEATDIAALGPNAVMPQIEGPYQYDSCIRALKAGVQGTLPVSIVTTYGGLDDPTGAKWNALSALGVSAVFVECYAALGAEPFADIPRMLAQGESYGIPRSKMWAVCGTYRGELPPQYTGIGDVGREFGLYLAEPMSSMQWGAWGVLKTVYYWHLTAGASLLHSERATTYPDGTTGLDKMFAWCEANKPTIRAAGSVSLQRVAASS